MNRRIATMALFLVPLFAGCPRREAGPAAPPASSKRAARVTVAKVATTTLSWNVDAVGTVEAKEEVPVAGGVAGVAGKVDFREGDRVTPETILFTIDEEHYRLGAQLATAEFDSAKADFVKATADWKQRDVLHTQKYISDDEWAAAIASRDRAAAQQARAEAVLSIAAKALSDCSVRPPIAGTINSRQISTGEYVKAETVVATIVDLSELRVRFNVPETEAFHVSAKMKIAFATRAAASEQPTGEIFWVSQVADAKTRTVECMARLASVPAGLRPGMSGTVSLVVERREGCIVAPEESVLPTERGFIAFVVVDGKARERKLKLGIQTEDGRMEVREGLKDGETLVVRGAAALKDGQEVTVVSDAEAKQ
ncbi:MAG: efflux RND transporter periplasmic adaptor subunit [Planctomycetes bacterium]|nr:efflux RND transporter periplasmic adaptor subunit [Planctomycetota bacterium]